MMFQINVTTLENQYEEKIYGACEVAERAYQISECDNVVGVEIISLDTGEVMYVENVFLEPYASPEFLSQIVKEIHS